VTQANIEPDDVESVVAKPDRRPMGLTADHEAGNDAIARRRIFNVVAAAFVNGLAIAGFGAVLPLHAVGGLGLSKAEYAGLLSWRMTGTTVGVILLGALGDRFGTRAMTLVALIVGGLLHAAVGFVPRAGFMTLIALIGAVASTTFVNLNYLTQLVGEKHQGWSNTLYRASGMLAGVFAPWIATRWLDHPGALFTAIGLAMAASAIFIAAYPLQEEPEPFRGWGEEFRGMGRMYASALRAPLLMVLLTLTCVWMALTSSGLTFAALRLTQELGASDEFYGNTCSLAAALTLVVLLAMAPFWARRGSNPSS
jgi:MFS family permease